MNRCSYIAQHKLGNRPQVNIGLVEEHVQAKNRCLHNRDIIQYACVLRPERFLPIEVEGTQRGWWNPDMIKYRVNRIIKHCFAPAGYLSARMNILYKQNV
jgi:hypothetical protein